MSAPLAALIVEDNEQDADLLVRTLVKGGFEVTYERVETEGAMRKCLEAQVWDVVIADFSLPAFSALGALQTIQSMELDLPLIIVSGSIDEEAAVEAIRAGAQDFMSKGKFARLVPAIEREMREARVRAERAQMRQQLLISDRMASIGTLAAGVAHEINNPLMAVTGGLDVLREELIEIREAISSPPHPGLGAWPPGNALSGDASHGDDAQTEDSLLDKLERAEQFLESAREAAERVRLIVRDLKAFSRPDDETTGPVDVEKAIDASIRMVKNEVRHRARLSKRYGSVPLVQGNEARLGQVFLNLLVNAAQAMPLGRAEENRIVLVTGVSDDQRVFVEVRDNGPGIPRDLHARIFDPFFTTKSLGTGTGLGLAICHRIVNDLGGQIQVESSPGEGTVFRTLLPIFSGVLPVDAPEQPVPETPAAKLLVIDDEPAVGKLVSRMLGPEHEVIVVTKSVQALELLRSGEHFDAILCDLMMPDVTGMDIHEALMLRAADDRPPIAFMTGGVFTKEARDFLDGARFPHLEKPFNRATLRTVIQVMLTGER